jgi:hypothetical protein
MVLRNGKEKQKGQDRRIENEIMYEMCINDFGYPDLWERLNKQRSHVSRHCRCKTELSLPCSATNDNSICQLL